MRTTPIIDIIRRYGLTSKRLNPRNRIKYEDAVKMVTQYENSELKIADVLDNTRKPSHNNCHCGLPGCGQKIRYEYILKSKSDPDAKELVAGSTCVWPTLGMSEIEKKDFFKMDQAIRDHYALLDWKDKNQDVLEKLEVLKENNITYFKAFWQEVESCPLLDEDAEFIRKVNVDEEVAKVRYTEKFRNVDNVTYRKAVSYIDELLAFYPEDKFVSSICYTAKRGRRLTGNQFRWLKVLVNRMWYDKNVKGTARDIYNTCEDYLQEVFSRNNFSSVSDMVAIAKVEEDVTRMGDKNIRWAWNLYKVKKAIITQ